MTPAPVLDGKTIEAVDTYMTYLGERVKDALYENHYQGEEVLRGYRDIQRMYKQILGSQDYCIDTQGTGGYWQNAPLDALYAAIDRFERRYGMSLMEDKDVFG